MSKRQEMRDKRARADRNQKILLIVRMASPAVNFQVDGIIVRNSPHGVGVKLLRN